ncbi:MAG: CbiX/SirB N-terminal domain-containing protein [Planctomycetota bacterium]
MTFLEQLEQLAGADERVGIIVVDHGSRRQQSNELLNDVVAMFRRVSGFDLVEPAHMELAEPSIATAFARSAARGAELVVVFPYFLSPGRHWNADIPHLAAEAAAQHAGVKHLVTQPLGLHDAMAGIMQDRILHCVGRSLQGGKSCGLCSDDGGCRLET